MMISYLKKKIKRAGYFVPFRWQLVILLVALLLAGNWLIKNNALPETSRTAIIHLFIIFTTWFALAILTFSFLSVFVPWMLFTLNKKNKRTSVKIKIAEKENLLNETQQIKIEIDKIIKPLFGFIRLRLFYDGENVSPKFTPVDSAFKKNFFSMTLTGLYKWPLKHIKEYEINKGIIYFEDFFPFFSLITQLPANSNFFTHPPPLASQQLIVRPKKTQETNTRIEEIRKVDGEFLNYKNFENNDDVRRIVWKIYAKNKELVVRIPETNDPYASHVYFYASFYNAISNDLYEAFNALFLNLFKTVTWNIYEQISRQNVLIQFIPDQQTKTYYADDPVQKIKYFISTASWQKQNDLRQYFDNRNASILCISSFSDALQVDEILQKAGSGLAVVFVELTNSFEKVKITTWLQWLFIKPERKSTDQLKIAFNLSPLKRKMLENENRIKKVIEKSNCEILIL
ncbi:MAG: DUF58 domain-containing protein [Bacteroidota bacterium]|nr:DUF58 domain-containing protein [Bacteroidota bacterium]